MTPAETLAAAIEKLEGMRNRAQPGPWTYANIESVGGGSLYGSEVRVAQIHWDNHDTRPVHRPICEDEADASGDLIVTLHATIDAQLAILRAALDDFINFGGKPSKFFANALALAVAILGEQNQ